MSPILQALIALTVWIMHNVALLRHMALAVVGDLPHVLDIVCVANQHHPQTSCQRGIIDGMTRAAEPCVYLSISFSGFLLRISVI